jgi:hypothetical protein
MERERDSCGRFVKAEPVVPPDVGVPLRKDVCLACAKIVLLRMRADTEQSRNTAGLETRINMLDIWWTRTKGRVCLVKPAHRKRRHDRAPEGCPYDLEYFMLHQGDK